MHGHAVERLYHRHASAIEAHCSRLLGRSADASDAMHETFVRVLTRSEEHASDEHAVRSLFRISTHVCIDVLRQQRVRSSALPGLVAQAGGARAEHAAHEARDQIEKLVADCDELGRSILALHGVQGLARNEVAAALGTSRKTVWARWRRIEQLAAQL
jgi:RNA polymerase sigma-70 factor (ECF subfamily)